MYVLNVLKSFLDKEIYSKYRSYVKESDFDKELRYILQGIDNWYAEHADSPSLEDVENLTYACGVPEKDQEYLSGIFNTLQSINGQDSIVPLLERFKTGIVCNDISVAAYDAAMGRGSVNRVLELADKLQNPDRIEEVEYVTDDIHEILNDTIRTPGLRWRLASLNRSLGSLRKGDFGFIFARPETGKTTFLASEVTHMAEQLKETDGPILWFNNEEQGKKVKLRCYQASLGATVKQISDHPDRALEKYRDKTKGKLRIVDSASISRHEVEAICKSANPSLIIFDQIDKVKGFKADREDLAMGAIYQWARELAKTYAAVVGICQADGTAEGERYLHMGHVSNAKTAKQAEADFILGIGKANTQGLEYMRFFNISKNKLAGDTDTLPGARHAKIEVIIEPDIARYSDIG